MAAYGNSHHNSPVLDADVCQCSIMVQCPVCKGILLNAWRNPTELQLSCNSIGCSTPCRQARIRIVAANTRHVFRVSVMAQLMVWLGVNALDMQLLPCRCIYLLHITC